MNPDSHGNACRRSVAPRSREPSIPSLRDPRPPLRGTGYSGGEGRSPSPSAFAPPAAATACARDLVASGSSGLSCRVAARQIASTISAIATHATTTMRTMVANAVPPRVRRLLSLSLYPLALQLKPRLTQRCVRLSRRLRAPDKPLCTSNGHPAALLTQSQGRRATTASLPERGPTRPMPRSRGASARPRGRQRRGCRRAGAATAARDGRTVVRRAPTSRQCRRGC